MAGNKWGVAGLFEKDPEPEDEGRPGDEALPLSTISGGLARPWNKPLNRLHVMTKDGVVHTLLYHELQGNALYQGGRMEFVFAGAARHWKVVVTGSGPRFWEVYDYLTLGRWPYLVEATRGFKGEDGDTVFDRIEIVDVTPK